MSLHETPIVLITEIKPHPNPEIELDVVVIDGWQCITKRGQFKKGDKAIYVPPDYNVPVKNPLFSFLDSGDKEFERITVKKFKGFVSQGLLVNVPDNLINLPVGTNVINELGIHRYEPPAETDLSTGGNAVSAPSGLFSSKFDVESYQKWIYLFNEGEEVIVTEKIHGANGRYTYALDKEGKFTQFCGSRTNWMSSTNKNIWWIATELNPKILEWCQNNPEKIVYGEVFGNVQNLRYGANKGEVFFLPFAVMYKGTWLDFDDAFGITNPLIGWCPIIYRGPFSRNKITEWAEGNSLVKNANHIREGCVIVPVKERFDEKLGRVALKVVSNDYYLKVKKRDK